MTETTPAPKPDLLAEAGELMRRFAKGEAISGTLYSDRNAAIVLASSILAVAGELRDIHNVLVDVRDSNRAIGGSLAALVQSLEPDALCESVKVWGAE